MRILVYDNNRGDNMNVGAKIKYLRKKKGITVEQLANSIGKNKAIICVTC